MTVCIKCGKEWDGGWKCFECGYCLLCDDYHCSCDLQYEEGEEEEQEERDFYPEENGWEEKMLDYLAAIWGFTS